MTSREQSAKKTQSKLIRRRKFLLIGCMVLCVYFVFSIISVQLEIYKENKKLNEIIAQINMAQLENDELSRVVVGEGEAAYIERIAREKLGYSAADERVFEDQAGS